MNIFLLVFIAKILTALQVTAVIFLCGIPGLLFWLGGVIVGSLFTTIFYKY